jgi:hypothetical protein
MIAPARLYSTAARRVARSSTFVSKVETVWLNQRQLTELFGKAKGTISEHIKHIFEDGELAEDAVVRYFRTTGPDGKRYEVAHYNLDMVIALGFRVRSAAAVRFRQWAA